MPDSSPKTSFLLRAGILLALLAVAWRWPPVSVAPAVQVPRPESTETPTPAVGFAKQDDAILFAFERFTREQHEDGSWGPHDDAGQAVEPAATETTSLVLLAFASAGQTHRQGKYKEQVQRGLDYLKEAGKVDDELKPGRLILPARGSTTRSQSLATLAICRLYSMSRDPQWARAAQFATNELGWARHRPQLNDATPDVAFWQLLGFVEAHMSFLEVPRDTVVDLQKWYVVRIRELPQESWEGTDFVGIHKFAILPYEQLKAPVLHFTERPLDQQPVLKQFATATALVEINYAGVGEPLQELRELTLLQFTREADLSDMALRVMILGSRLYKLPPSKQATDDDFPLMSKHQDL